MTSKLQQEKDLIYRERCEEVYEDAMRLMWKGYTPYTFVNVARIGYQKAYERLIRRYQ